MRIYNLTQQKEISSSAILAKGFFARAKGLLGKSKLESDEALVLPYCQAIHMMFMKFAIDVVFVNKSYQVVGLVENIKPFMLSPVFLKAFCAIELPAGAIAKTRTAVGDLLAFKTDQI